MAAQTNSAAEDFCEKNKNQSAIIRNNRNYLLANIQPNDELMDSMLSLNCITYEQSHFIQWQRLNRDKNAELLYVIRSFSEETFSNFVNCLRQTNQRTVARILENGGVVIKVKVLNRGAKCTTSMKTQLLFHQNIEDLRNGNKPWSKQTDKLVTQLREEGIEILNSHLDRKTVVVWIWCQSQAALENIQKLYESNQLMDILFGVANIRLSVDGTCTSEIIQSKLININGNQFKKTVVVCPISVNFTERIELGRNEVHGVVKLRNEIYVLCLSFPNVICVIEDRNPFRLQKKINIKEIKSPFDIGSNEKENCLYVSDFMRYCVWKITRETDDQYKIVKWLTTDYQPSTLSVSCDGQLLVVRWKSSILMVYGSDAELRRTIQLPRDIKMPIHAVETSTWNFIILHWWMEEKEAESGASESNGEWLWVISEVTRDGQNIIRRFIPSNETQKMISPRYISLDSDDRVFVADTANRVILLDSDLKWNRILCPTKEETVKKPWRLWYDEEKKQLIVGGVLANVVNVYTLSRK